ncbi:coiled-coil domain-containing protein 50 isoform X3 [Conger conger]|uniref:coiled-coil domain-containing protein 50 isoform X3 n=1 Tax=Conger conger TaxID=82655 RepID=UPI002A5A88BF|nr:coiled-coil domain-containing protein 50 isoform X3 [Conger conger]
MADFSIDQKKLPGVKEVCRDFAVLEDHTLAHSLQEQEIESHLASNIHKSRLVQQDLQVAKRLQEEEDLRAKARVQRKHKDIERSDNEIAQEIQEQLVRQAERQRQQEENDEAIARKLHEKEMKEEKRRKQLEASIEEDFYDDKGGRKLRGEYGLREATQGITRLDLQEQELKDMEVARRLQEEEMKESQMDKRAAQVAQDEEIARLLMEEEKKMFKKSRDREKPCMERRRQEGDSKPVPEEVVRPRSQEDHEYQRPRNHKPARPAPRTHNYENVDSGYAYPAPPYDAHTSSRPETAYKDDRWGTSEKAAEFPYMLCSLPVEHKEEFKKHTGTSRTHAVVF